MLHSSLGRWGFRQLFALCIVILSKPLTSVCLQSTIWSHPVGAFCFLALFLFWFVLGYVYTVNLCWHVCIHPACKELGSPADQAA